MLIEKGLDESINEKTEDAINAHFIEVCPFVGMVDHVFEVYNGVFLTMQEDLKRKSAESQIELFGNKKRQPYRQKADDKSDIVFLLLYSN